MQKAFTMIELVFAITVIGILAVVAVPKLAPIINDAQTGKAKATLASVRSAVATERQKRMLQGKYDDPISDLGNATYAFSVFDNDSNKSVLDYPIANCSGDSSSACWKRVDATHYRYQFTSASDAAKFKLFKNRFDCDDDTADCAKLTK